MYEFLDAALVRAPIWHPEVPNFPWPNLTGPDATPDNWRTWMQTVWEHPEFALAVETASPDLARQVTKILNRHNVADAAVHRAVVSTLRYLLRAQTRATPFGLLAGIAPVRIGDTTTITVGSQHRPVTRPDATWLHEQIAGLEADATIFPCLSLIANNLMVRRRQHLVLDHRAGGAADAAPERVQIRATPPVLAAIDAAADPIRAADLLAQLTEQFPTARRDTVDRLVAKLVSQRFLLTSLRPGTTEPDPLTATLRVLDACLLPASSEAARQRTRLHAVRTALSECDAALVPADDRRARAHAAVLMTTSTPPATDLRLDWHLTIPKAVAVEAARAAGIMARLARRPSLSTGWANWHARFLDRYGPRAVVPVLDAVDADTGIGYPAGYLDSPYPAESAPLTERDKRLLNLAHHAVVRGDLELVLDEQLISELSVIGLDAPVQPSAEVTVRLQAASVQDLDNGRFELHVTGMSRGIGTTTGRFLQLLDDADREHSTQLYAATPGVHTGALTAQLSAVPLHARTGNVAHAPQLDLPIIPLGEYYASGSDRIPLTDLAVTADATCLHLVSLSRKRPIHPILLSAVDLAYHSHPLTRFLLEASNALAAPCTGFEWGAAHVLPFLPAVRSGQTVLSPARWILTAADLPAQPDSHAAWDNAFATWQRQVKLPPWTYLGDGDQCIRLHLAEPSHRTLLRDELRRKRRVMLRSAPTPRDLGWADGRVHEIAVPVRATRRIAPVRWSNEITGRRHGHVPTHDGHLYLKLQSTRDQQDAVLTRHVPDLQQRLGTRLTNCWFIRYDHPGKHVRLRLTPAPQAADTAIQQVSAWSEKLQDEGLISSVSWETYYPETARFGGTTALAAAEAFFTTDSAAAIAQLSASAAKDGPDIRALTAASFVDLTVHLVGDEVAAMHWLITHTATDSTPPPRRLYKQAIAFANTGDIGLDVAAAWQQRRKALSAYRDALHRAGTIEPTELLPDLLHLHHARVNGPDLIAERTCLHLARAAALSRISRTRRMQPA